MSLSVGRSVCLSAFFVIVRPSVCLSVCLGVCVYVCPSVRMFVGLPVCSYVGMSACLISACLISACLPVCPSDSLHACLYVYPSVGQSVCLSVRRPVRVSVCVSPRTSLQTRLSHVVSQTNDARTATDIDSLHMQQQQAATCCCKAYFGYW